MKINNLLRQLTKAVTPTFLVNFVQKSRNPIKFRYGYPNWDSAVRASIGYSDEAIVDKVAQETVKMIVEKKGWVRDGVYFENVQYGFEVLSSLSLISQFMKTLKVLDFGGALGSTYFQNKDILYKFGVELNWTIVEQEHYVRYGKETLHHLENLTFFSNLNDALEQPCDVVIFSSVLCYLENPYQVIEQVVKSRNKPKSIIIDRTPVNYSDVDTFAVQEVNGSIHRASLPIRDLSIERIMKALGGHYEIVYDWDCPMQPDRKSTSRGMFLLLK